MNVLSELDKLYKVKLEKADKWNEFKLHNELLNIEKRKEMIKAESGLLLDSCVIWQNGPSKCAHTQPNPTVPINTHSMAYQPFPSSSSLPHPSSPDGLFLSAPAPRDRSPANSPSFEEGEIRDDQPEEIQTIDQNDEAVKKGKSEATAPMTKNVAKVIERNSPSSGPSPWRSIAANQLASVSKGLSFANLESSKLGQTSLFDHLVEMRINAKNLDKLREETGKTARIRMPIKNTNEIDLNSKPSEWLLSNTIPADVTHSWTLTHPNYSNLDRWPANANSLQSQPLLLEQSQGSRGVDKRKWAEDEDDNAM
jgi:hypothetical protein